MSRQPPSHASPRAGGQHNSPSHKVPRVLNQSPRAAPTTIAPALTPVLAPANPFYRTSSHADSYVRRTDTPHDDDHTPLPSPVATAAVTTPVKSARRTLTPPTTTPTSTPHTPADPSTWEDDDSVTQCHTCHNRFTLFLRKHHCRHCGRIYCDNCSRSRRRLRHTATTTADEPVRVCDGCERMLALEEEEESRVGGGGSRQSTPPVGGRVVTPVQTQQLSDVMSVMSLAGESMDSSGSGSGSGSGKAMLGGGGGSVDWAPLVAALLAEVECGERLRRVQDRMRDEMDAMLRLMAAEMLTGGGKQTVEVDVVS